MLDQEFNYFLKHQQHLVEQYKDRYIVIVGNDVVGNYRSNEIAYYEAKKKYKEGSFLIQHCIEGENAYTCTFHSNILLDA